MKNKTYQWLVVNLLMGGFSVPAYACNIPKSYYKNVSCTSSSSFFLAKKDDGKPVALLNKSGKLVVNLMRYQRVDAKKLFEGLLPVERNKKLGYINMTGREVVPAVYDVLSGSVSFARRVSNGRIIVKKAGRLGVIDKSNTVIVPFSSRISSISNYRQGRAKMVYGGINYWVDSAGNKTKIQPASVRPSNSSLVNPISLNKPATTSQSNSTTTTQVALPSSTNMKLHPHTMDGKWGFIDDNDVTMITYSFDEVMPYSEGMAAVRIDDKWGFIDKGGNLLVQFRFKESGVSRDDTTQIKPFVFNNGKAWVGNLVDGAKICINKKGVNVSCQ